MLKVRQQILCCGREPNTSAPPRGGNISKESRTSAASKTFLTDMLHFSSATDKVHMFFINVRVRTTRFGYFVAKWLFLGDPF